MGYDIVLHELVKIAFGVLFVVYFKLALIGAILTVVVANTADICFYFATLYHEFMSHARWSYVKSWGKTSVLSFYGMVGGRISSLDMMLLILFGGALARAYYGAAYTVTFVILYTSTLTLALYPRLLSGGGGADVEASAKLSIIFAVPTLVGVVTLADRLLAVLNPAYASARFVLYFLSLEAFLSCFSNIFESIITGTERVDAQDRFSVRDLTRSRLFILPTLSYVQAALALPIFYFVLRYFKGTELQSAVYCATVHLIFASAFLIVKFLIAKRCLSFRDSKKNLAQ